MADFYIDHDVNIVLAELLGALGHTATTVRDQGTQRAWDAEHLALAARNGWILVTRNADHFRVLHEAWRTWTENWNVPAAHAGILLIPHGRIRELALQISSLTQMNLPLTNQLYDWNWQRGWLLYRIARQ